MTGKRDPFKRLSQNSVALSECTARLDACLGQAVNYIVRAPYKGNQVEDLKKAIFYLNKFESLHDCIDACFATMNKVGLIFLSDSPSKQRGVTECHEITKLENSKEKVYWTYFSFPRGLNHDAR